jgi:hypothetical protein
MSHNVKPLIVVDRLGYLHDNGGVEGKETRVQISAIPVLGHSPSRRTVYISYSCFL